MAASKTGQNTVFANILALSSLLKSCTCKPYGVIVDLFHRRDQIDILFKHLVNDLVELLALGGGLALQVSAHLFIEIDRQVQLCIGLEELAAFTLGKVVLVADLPCSCLVAGRAEINRIAA